MSLKDRLGRLTGETDKPFQSDPKQDKIGELRRKIDEVMGRRERIIPQSIPRTGRSAIPLEQVVFGEEAWTPYGNFFFSLETLKSDDAHGYGRISDFTCPRPSSWIVILAWPSMRVTGSITIC